MRWWRVIVRVQGQSFQLDTADPEKIGPWLTDIVNDLQLSGHRPGVPIDMQVTIS